MSKYFFEHSGITEEKEVPDSWKDVTFNQFLELYNLPIEADVYDRVAVLTGISVDKVRTINTSAGIVLADQVSFTYDFTPLVEQANNYDHEKWDKWNIGDDHVIKYEMCRMAIGECDKKVFERFGVDPGTEWSDIKPEVKEALQVNRINAAPTILKQYADIDTSTAKLFDCYGLVNFFLHRLEGFKIDTQHSVTVKLNGKNMKPELRN